MVYLPITANGYLNFLTKLVPEDTLNAFQNLKVEIENLVVRTIDETVPFEVETAASDFAVAATLNQVRRPVAFFFQDLFLKQNVDTLQLKRKHML